MSGDHASFASTAEPRAPGAADRARAALQALLAIYAGIFFSSSRLLGAVVLLVCFLSPLAAACGLLAVSCAITGARAAALISDKTPATAYAYSALFIGICAPHTFQSLPAALAFAVLGAAASVVLTAALAHVLSRAGLLPLSLPFVIVYFCALWFGQALGAAWAAPPSAAPDWTASWPEPLRLFCEGLGAIFFLPRADVGLMLLAGLCASGLRAPLIALVAFGLTLGCSYALGLPPALRFGALINAMLTAVGLCNWYGASWQAYLRAGLGALLCVVLTAALAGPLGRLGLVPLSLPFNLSIYALLLIEHQRSAAARPTSDALRGYTASA